MQIWLLALAGAVAPAPAKVLAASPSPNASIETATVASDKVTPSAPAANAKSAPKQPVVLEPPAKTKPLLLSQPREATGWKAAEAAQEVPKVPVVLDPPSNATALVAPKIPTVLDPPSDGKEVPKIPVVLDPPSDGKAVQTPVLLKSTENATDVAVAADEPDSGHDIHDAIYKAHKEMCEDGRLESDHCVKFRGALDDMHEEVKDLHEDHQAAMSENTEAESTEAATEGAAEATSADAAPDVDGSVEYTTEVEKVEPHEPVITRHKYPYKTGPCAKSGVAAVALLFSGLLFV